LEVPGLHPDRPRRRRQVAIGATRGKLEDAAPVVSTSNPQAHTLASLTGAGVDKVETGLILLVALLVELGGLGPFVTMNLAKAARPMKVPVVVPTTREPAPQPDHTAPVETDQIEQLTGGSSSTAPRLIYSAAGPEHLASDLERFLNLHARRDEGSTLGSTDLLARYNGSRRKRGLPTVNQRRFGDTMNALGHSKKLRLSGGRVHYQGLTWVEPNPMRLVA
jgi:hypothetical protein